MPQLKGSISLLWRRLKYELTPEPSQGPRSLVVKLPPELLLQIADHLNLYDQIQFSQTCVWLHSLLHINSAAEIAALTYQKRLEFFHAASLRRPQSWVCPKCVYLHHLEQAGVPSQITWVIKACQKKNMPNIYGPYDLHERHIQLALKLSQTDFRNANQEYLTKLMKPYTRRSHWPPISGLTPGSSTVMQDFVAVPRIIDGSFLVQFSMEFFGVIGRCIVYEDLDGTRICPHMEVRPRRHPRSLTRLEISAQVAFTSGKVQQGWCGYCLTDYTVKVENGRVKICAWQDFGGQRPPMHHEWTSLTTEGHRNRYREPLYFESGLAKERFLSEG
ncbi:hypothetical protein CC79DRAFT_1325950 [Sarocladium strictum]